jgi:DNA-binding CsgD family transcriptional regulator
MSEDNRELASGPLLFLVRSPVEASGGRPGWTLVHRYERDGLAYIVARQRPSPTGVASLTGRERQVVTRLARGETTKEAAYEMGISDATVRVLLCRAAGKLGAASRQDLLGRPEVQRLRETG